MYYTLYQKRVYRVYQGGVYPDTADDPCPAALVAGYSDTPRYTAIHRDVSIQLYSRYTIHPDTASLCTESAILQGT